MTSRHPSAISTDTITTGSSATSMVTDRTTVFRTFHILYWGSKINRRSLGLDRAERSLKQRLDLSVQEKPPGVIRGALGLREWWHGPRLFLRFAFEDPFEAFGAAGCGLVFLHLAFLDAGLNDVEGQPEGHAENEQRHFGAHHRVDRSELRQVRAGPAFDECCGHGVSPQVSRPRRRASAMSASDTSMASISSRSSSDISRPTSSTAGGTRRMPIIDRILETMKAGMKPSTMNMMQAPRNWPTGLMVATSA